MNENNTFIYTANAKTIAKEKGEEKDKLIRSYLTFFRLISALNGHPLLNWTSDSNSLKDCSKYITI